MGLFGKKKIVENEPFGSPDRAGHSIETDRTLTHHGEDMSNAQLKRATRTRKIWSLISAFCLLLSVIFLILVEVGNTKVGKVLSSIYFIRLDLSQIIPSSVPAGASFTNSIAQTLGLHDYYQVGLWNFCQGNVGVGINDCMKTQTLYWFNPVEILLSQLLSGATSKFGTSTALHQFMPGENSLTSIIQHFRTKIDIDKFLRISSSRNDRNLPITFSGSRSAK